MPDAQRFAERLGVVSVDYGKRLDVANNANRALHTAWRNGVPMPTEIHTVHEGEEEVASYSPSLTGGRGYIAINVDHPLWDDPAGEMRRALEDNELSTDSPYHPIMHELGEMVCHQSIGEERFDEDNEANHQDFEEFRNEDLAHVFDVLGDRATLNQTEFVAECFAAMQLGRADELKQDAEIMGLYERYGGKDIRQYDP